MASWKKVVVSGSSAELANISVDSLSSGVVTGAAGNLTTTAINGSGNIVATTGASGLVHSGSFSGSFEGDGSSLTGVSADSLANSLTDGNGISDFTFDGSGAATVSVEADGSTLSVGASGVKVADLGIDTGQLAANAVTTAKITDANVTNAKLANDGIMLGTTDISLGTTGSSVAGLTLTGAVGSGSFSGSFQGDGSGLTNLPDATDAKYLVYQTGSGTNSIKGISDGTNTASGNYSVVGGGQLNTGSGAVSVVGGGCKNQANSLGSSIGGGRENIVSFAYGTVSGGYKNCAGSYGFVGGGYGQSVTGLGGVIVGGDSNTTSGGYSGILGGTSNTVSGTCSGILGGTANTVNTNKSFIVGSNISSTVANHTHVNNLSTAGNITGSAISASGDIIANAMSGSFSGSFVGDGSGLTGLPSTDAKYLVYQTGSGTNSIKGISNGTNVASGAASVVGGGISNQATGTCSTIGGGNGNTAGNKHATVAGGKGNTASNCYSAIGGGGSNTVSGRSSLIGGGDGNTVSANYSTVSGGYSNTVSATYSGILGGDSNSIGASGTFSGILGGRSNTVNTACSFIVGQSITSTVANHTHVNNLSTLGNITGSAISASGGVIASSAQVADLTSGRVVLAGTGGELEDNANLTFNGSTLAVTGDLSVSQDATVTRDLTVSRNLIVQGTASFQHTTDLDIADRFIKMASGSTSNGSGGFAVQQTSATDSEALGWINSSVKRWGVTGSFDATNNTFTPDAFLSLAIEGSGTDPDATPEKYDKKGNIFIGTDQEIYIYS